MQVGRAARNMKNFEWLILLSVFFRERYLCYFDVLCRITVLRATHTGGSLSYFMNVLCSCNTAEYRVLGRYQDPSNIITDLFINPKRKNIDI